MTDPRWAALAAEIAYEINPTSAVIPGKEILARVRNFVEPQTPQERAYVQRIRKAVTPGLRGRFDAYDYVMLTSGTSTMSAREGAIARVLGYRLSDFDTRKTYVELQWSRDEYSGQQNHGGYDENNFTFIDHIDPF